ncbi:MAG: ATP-binding protein [Janthinobacterium lividum]
MAVKIALEVPDDFLYVSMVPKIGRILLEHHHAPPQDIDDIELVVGELCSNASNHACFGEADSYHVVIEHHDTHVLLVVEDQGQGFDPANLPPVGEPRPDANGGHRIGGFGLHLVKLLTDHVEIMPSLIGTTVRAEKRYTR